MNSQPIIRGIGPHAVICLNGWFGHAGDWGPWADIADGGRFTWIFPDYRGYGRRQNETGDYSLDEIAADLEPVVALADKYQSVTVLGHSMGGAYAQYLLTQHPGKFQAFVGLSPVPASGTPLPEEQRAFFASAGEQVETRRAIMDITTGNRLSACWLDHMADETLHNSTDEAVGSYFHTWVNCDFLEQLGRQEIPALTIVGATDPAVTVQVVQDSYGKTFPHLELVEFPDAGHYPMFESPVRLATEIEGFLSRHVVTDHTAGGQD